MQILFMIKITERFCRYFTYGSMHLLQISAHLKSDTDEVAL